MPKCNKSLKEFRLQAKWSQNKFAREADLDRATISNAENGKEVSELTIAKMVSALARGLKSEISPQQICL